MITVINERAVNDSRSAGDILIENTNIANDLQMSILLAEHNYLLRTGNEIDYYDEEGYLTEAGVAVFEAIGKAINDIKNNVLAAIKKVWNAIKAKIDELVYKFASIGVNKAKFEKAAALASAMDFSKVDKNVIAWTSPYILDEYVIAHSNLTKSSALTTTVSDLTGDKEIEPYKAGQYFNAVKEKVENDNYSKVDTDYLTKVIWESGSVTRNIKNMEKDVSNYYDGLKKDLKAQGEKLLSNSMKKVNVLLRNSSAEFNDHIKVFNTHLSNCVALAKIIVKMGTKNAAELSGKIEAEKNKKAEEDTKRKAERKENQKTEYAAHKAVAAKKEAEKRTSTMLANREAERTRYKQAMKNAEIRSKMDEADDEDRESIKNLDIEQKKKSESAIIDAESDFIYDIMNF